MNKCIELKKQHQKEVDSFDGLFFAFNRDQLKEGLKKVGLEENKTNLICSIGAGGYLRKDKVKDFVDMFARHKKELKEFRKQNKTIKIKFAGIDGWNRPVFKSIEKPYRFYGDTCNLFNSDATEKEVLSKIEIDNLCYFGDHFGCEPCGTTAGNIEIVK